MDTNSNREKLASFVKSIPDFPKEGILFRDVTGILDSAEGLALAIGELEKSLQGIEFDYIAGLEARGFIFGAPLALRFGKPFVPVRKKGKLPRKTISRSYNLEYGTAEIEIHADTLRPGAKVVIIDDLLATGGTAHAAAKLIEDAGCTVAKIAFLIELAGFEARSGILSEYETSSILVYPGK
jgi:adenine phosphoribosyltransferase